ncbi:MAG TPA: hypothetical protein VKE69_00520, partial [Planctomycetota bacterium]|nr:hypothetical protein [Planctomycetota bacterium]
MRGALAAALAIAALPSAEKPKLSVRIEASPPVWLEGEALHCQLVIENKGAATAVVPGAWLAGDGFRMRPVPSGAFGRPSSEPVDPAPKIVAPSPGPYDEIKIPA